MREYLDLREINGYSIQFTGFQPVGEERRGEEGGEEIGGAEREGKGGKGKKITCLVYIGLPTNPQFLGPQDADELARRIIECRGPSGENREYLYKLEEGLLGLSGESGDAHVSDLVRRCRAIEALEGERGGESGGEEDGSVRVGGGQHVEGSTEEVEEVEK